MSVISFTELVAKSKGAEDPIYLLRGYDSTCTKPAWYIIKVPRLKAPILLEKINARSEWLDLPEYGEILEKGWGEEPPADTVAKYDTSDAAPDPVA